jgi:hypothetical protein
LLRLIFSSLFARRKNATSSRTGRSSSKTATKDCQRSDRAAQTQSYQMRTMKRQDSTHFQYTKDLRKAAEDVKCHSRAAEFDDNSRIG